MTFHKQYTHALSMQKQTQCLSLMSNAGGFGESKTAMSCHVVRDMQKDTGEHKIERCIHERMNYMHCLRLRIEDWDGLRTSRRTTGGCSA